mmetsp:Transcript_15328/g.62550  ORF Transcript_15328/g.62550 Transcript_15328/m.62550 type:complete len:100 (+) Transcript_15328:2002-2301(+)
MYTIHAKIPLKAGLLESSTIFEKFCKSTGNLEQVADQPSPILPKNNTPSPPELNWNSITETFSQRIDLDFPHRGVWDNDALDQNKRRRNARSRILLQLN